MKSSEFLRDVILPMIQKAHDNYLTDSCGSQWKQQSFTKSGGLQERQSFTKSGGLQDCPFVGTTIAQHGLFKGHNFDDIPTVYRDKIVAASRADAIQQKGYEFRLPDPSHGEGKMRIYRFFVVFPGKKNKSDAFYRDAVYKFFLWISVLMNFSPEECSREMNVYLYLLPDLKVLPTEKHQALSQEHVNTAFTRSCSRVSEINIFREEEWFKVFIHETFHNNGLDFSLHFNQYDAAVQNELKRCFPALRSPVFLYESYCEFWAETLHSLYVAFFLSTRRPRGATTRKISRHRESSLWTRAQKIFKEEHQFSMLQCVKVLDHHGLTFADLVLPPKANAPTYTDINTNSFAYYVIKCIMFHCNFLDWHLATNGPTLRFSEKNIVGFCHWLHTVRYRMLSSMKRMEGVYKRVPKSSKMAKTLRMVMN